MALPIFPVSPGRTRAASPRRRSSCTSVAVLRSEVAMIRVHRPVKHVAQPGRGGFLPLADWGIARCGGVGVRLARLVALLVLTVVSGSGARLISWEVEGFR